MAAFYAGIAGALFTQTTALASLDVFSFERSADLMLVLVIGGTGYLYGGLIGAVVFRMLQEVFSTITPQYWQFWIGLVLVVIVLVGRARMHRWALWLPNLVIRQLGGRKAVVAVPRATRHDDRAGNQRAGTSSSAGSRVTRDLSLRVEQGARHALIGPNGAGKTTVINLLTGVLKPNAGRILLEGNDITDLPVHKRVLRGLSRTFQINQLYADLTPLETIGLAVSERLGRGGDWWRGWARAATSTQEIAETLARFHLLDVMNELTATLPYGKQRLLEIAVAIAAKPRVLLLDEPAAGVPESERHDILAAVAALPRDVTVLLIEHDMDLVFSFADRISVLVNGAHAGRGPAGRGGARSTGQGGLSRRGRRCLICSPSRTCAPATARRWCCRACRCALGEGQVLALLGRNGTGKTTLINSIVGITRRFGGTVSARRARYHPDAAGPAGAGRASAGCRRSAISSAR